MAILNIGSLNWDHAFKVSHLPAKGETVAAKSANLSLGGKGQNGAIKQPRTRSDLMRVLISLTAPPSAPLGSTPSHNPVNYCVISARYRQAFCVMLWLRP
jgi:hypothetical protein